MQSYHIPLQWAKSVTYWFTGRKCCSHCKTDCLLSCLLCLYCCRSLSLMLPGWGTVKVKWIIWDVCVRIFVGAGTVGSGTDPILLFIVLLLWFLLLLGWPLEKKLKAPLFQIGSEKIYHECSSRNSKWHLHQRLSCTWWYLCESDDVSMRECLAVCLSVCLCV